MNDDVAQPASPDDPTDGAPAAAERAERFIERMLDGSPDAAEAEPAGWERAERERIADMQFLDALLVHAFRKNDLDREARLHGVMAALDALAPVGLPMVDGASLSPGLPPRTARRAPARRFYAVALTMAVAAVIWTTLWPLARNPRSVNASVARAILEASQAPDRQYDVTFFVSLPLGARHREKATLYVQGADRYALRKSAPLTNGDLWIGGNGGESWVIPVLGPVFVSRDVRLLETLLGDEIVSTPILRISTILKRMSEHYELEILGGERIPMFVGTQELVECERIRGRLKGQPGQLPDVIDVWATRSGGTAVRLVLDWQRANGVSGLASLTLELSAQPELPRDWYAHSAHHDPDRTVLDFPGGETGR
jgi:hypothetical protein